MRSKHAFVMLLVLLALSACASPGARPTITSAPHRVTFTVSHISVEPSGKTHIELAVANSGSQELPPDSFVAHFELKNDAGELRAVQDALLPRIPPSTGDLTTVVELDAPLQEGAYRVAWGAPGLGSTLVTFEVVAESGALRLGKEIVEIAGPGYPHPDDGLGQ